MSTRRTDTTKDESNRIDVERFWARMEMFAAPDTWRAIVEESDGLTVDPNEIASEVNALILKLAFSLVSFRDPVKFWRKFDALVVKRAEDRMRTTDAALAAMPGSRKG